MRPEGVFTSFHKLISLLQPEVALSRSGWYPFALIPGQFAACDCIICKLCIEPVNSFSLIIKDIQSYGGTSIQIPKFDHAPTLYDGGYNPALGYCLKTQVMEAVKNIDRDLSASILQSPNPIDCRDRLTVVAEKEREAGRLALASPYANTHLGWCGLSDGPGIKACGGSRAFVDFSKRPVQTDNLVRLPVPLHSEAQAEDGHEICEGAARVIDFQEWIVTKETRAANKDKMTRQKIKRMTMREKRLRILDLISDDDMDHQTLANILEFLESIAPDTESRT
jgi:hypothetical protein